MKRILIAAGILSFALAGVGSAQETASSAANGTHYTQGQLKQLVRDAHTPKQYRTLADYYAGRQNNYLRQAEEEKQEWVRRSQNIMGVAAKYPRPADSARNLYEYFTYKASETGALAVKYSQLAAQEPPAKE